MTMDRKPSFLCDSTKCTWDDKSKMFYASAAEIELNLSDPPKALNLQNDGVTKLSFYRVGGALDEFVLYNAIWLPAGKHYGPTIPMKQYYLKVIRSGGYRK